MQEYPQVFIKFLYYSTDISWSRETKDENGYYLPDTFVQTDQQFEKKKMYEQQQSIIHIQQNAR